MRLLNVPSHTPEYERVFRVVVGGYPTPKQLEVVAALGDGAEL
jgi:hypothetical protein